MKDIKTLCRESFEVWLDMAKSEETSEKPLWARRKYQFGCPFCNEYAGGYMCLGRCSISTIIGGPPSSKAFACEFPSNLTYFHQWAQAKKGSRQERSACWKMANAFQTQLLGHSS